MRWGPKRETRKRLMKLWGDAVPKTRDRGQKKKRD